MNVDLIFYKSQNRNEATLEKTYHLSSLKQTILDRTSHSPKVHFDFDNLEKDCYYLLFTPFAEQNKEEIKPFASQIIYMSAEWGDLENLSNQFDFLAIVTIPNYPLGKEVFFGRKKIVEAIDEMLDNGYSNNDPDPIGEADLLSVKGGNGEGLLNHLVDFLNYYEQLIKE